MRISVKYRSMNFNEVIVGVFTYTNIIYIYSICVLLRFKYVRRLILRFKYVRRVCRTCK